MNGFINYYFNQLQGSVLRRNVVYTFGRQMVAALAQLATVIIIAREFGAEGNGQYAMVILLPTLLVSFLNFGIGPANVFYLGRKETHSHHATVENAKIAFFIGGLGTICALIVLWHWGKILFPGVPLQFLYIGLAAFPLALLLGYLNSILQGIENFKAFNWATLTPPLATLLYISIAIFILDMGLLGAVVGFVLGYVTGLFVVGFFLHRQFKIEKKINNEPEIGIAYKQKAISYGWKAYFSNIMAFVNYRADIFLVNLFIGPAATGIYVIAVHIAEKLWMLSQAASTVLLPRLSSMYKDPLARLRLTNKAVLGVLLLTAAAAFLSAFLLFVLIEPIFGPEFVGALSPFLWLLPGIIAGAGARVQSNCIAAAGKPEWNMYVAIGVVTLNIIGNVILIPIWGIDGAAIATSLAYMANAGIKLFLVRRTLFL